MKAKLSESNHGNPKRDLNERAEELLDGPLVHAYASVPQLKVNLHLALVKHASLCHRKLNDTLVSELGGIGNKVDEDLSEAMTVADDKVTPRWK